MTDETPKPPEDSPLSEDTATRDAEKTTDAAEGVEPAAKPPEEAPAGDDTAKQAEATAGADEKAAKPTLTDEEKAAKIAAAKAKAAAKKAAEADAEPKPPWEEKPVPPERTDAAGEPDVVALAEAIEGSVLKAERFAGDLTVTVPAAKIVAVCTYLKNERSFAFLVDLTAIDWPDREEGRFDVVYWMHRFDDEFRLRLVTVVAEDQIIESVTCVWKVANWMEREVYDLYGIVFANHPSLERILTWEGFNGHPLRKDFPVEGIDTGAAIYPDVYPQGGGPVVEEETGGGIMSGPNTSLFDVEEMEINFGPQHPATHGVLRVLVKLDGEKIVDAKPIIGYLHRGTEKLFETMDFPACIPHTDRMDYVAAATNNQGFCVTMEKLLGISIPPRAAYIRMILAELQRLASHLVWFATHAIDIGAITPFFYNFRDRDEILDLFEEYCGARLTLNTMKIGGVPYELPDGWVDRCRTLMDVFPSRIDEYETLLTENRIWKLRTVDIGIVSPEDAIEWGLTGPPLRGSGIKWDIRKVFPYDRYDEIDFEVPIGVNGDTYDRYLVRVEEMRQSVRIIQQCLDKLPEGPLTARAPKVLRAKEGMVYGSVEAPKGELGYFVVTTEKSTKPYRCRVRPPSFINLQMLPEMVRGHLVADMIAVIGTLDIVLGEIDR